MESDPYLPKCPKCGAWPMPVADQEDGYTRKVKFVCARCATVTNAQIRRATTHPPMEDRPTT